MLHKFFYICPTKTLDHSLIEKAMMWWPNIDRIITLNFWKPSVSEKIANWAEIWAYWASFPDQLPWRILSLHCASLNKLLAFSLFLTFPWLVHRHHNIWQKGFPSVQPPTWKTMWRGDFSCGFGQHFPRSVPGVPGVGRATGTPQGQLLPGLWPEEPVGASKTVCLSTCCCALLPGLGLAHTRGPCPTNLLPCPVPADGSCAWFFLLTLVPY